MFTQELIYTVEFRQLYMYLHHRPTTNTKIENESIIHVARSQHNRS